MDELEEWQRIISDGDWAVKEEWAEFNDGFLGQKATPEKVKFFLAHLVRRLSKIRDIANSLPE